MLFDTLRVALLIALSLPSQAQEDAILQKADALLEEAKGAYESARDKSSAAAFVEAGFKLEEARIKYLVLQEIGTPEKQKTAVDRLRAVNQLSKLIHDGKVAVSGKSVDTPAPKPAEPAPGVPPPDSEPKPASPAAVPDAAVDIMKRTPVPLPEKQKEAEKLLKDLLKEQYAKKAPADRVALARSLLDQARKSRDETVSLWVCYQEAQQIAIQTGDVATALATVDETARFFDIDRLSTKNMVLIALSKSAKTPEDFALLVEALDRFIDELVAADLYDLADKSAATAVAAAKRANDNRLIGRMMLRAKEVADMKSRFAAMKSILQTLAKNPDDAGANLEMGQFLCFAKGGWDLGLRFLAKGSDSGLKSLAEKELSILTSPADEGALADAWYELGEKEKAPYRKNQILSHAREHYEAALPSAAGLIKARIEKRLESIQTAIGSSTADKGAINLLKLVDLKKDTVNGRWSMKGTSVTCENINCSRLQLPYLVPAEYDLAITFQKVGDDTEVFGIVTEKGPCTLVIQPGVAAAFEKLDGKAIREQDPSTKAMSPSIPLNKTIEVRILVRRSGIRTLLDGTPLVNFEGNLNRLTPNSDWANTINPKCPTLACHNGGTIFLSATLSPLLEPGKPLR